MSIQVDKITGISRELKDMSAQWRESIIEVTRNERNSLSILTLLKRGYQVIHILVGLSFLILAIIEFVRNPPYFDTIRHHNNNSYDVPGSTFYVSKATCTYRTGIKIRLTPYR